MERATGVRKERLWRFGWQLPTCSIGLLLFFVCNYGEYETLIFLSDSIVFLKIQIPTSWVLLQFGALNPTEVASKASGMWDNIAGEATGAVCS